MPSFLLYQFFIIFTASIMSLYQSGNQQKTMFGIPGGVYVTPQTGYLSPCSFYFCLLKFSLIDFVFGDRISISLNILRPLNRCAIFCKSTLSSITSPYFQSCKCIKRGKRTLKAMPETQLHSTYVCDVVLTPSSPQDPKHHVDVFGSKWANALLYGKRYTVNTL